MLAEFVSDAHALDSIVSVMRLLADPTRLKLLGLLEQSERNVTELCRALQVPQPSVSHHLGLLRSAGVVRNRRAGKQVYYSLNPGAMERLAGHVELALPAGACQIRLEVRHAAEPRLEYRAAVG
jgi:DNA-binding transcriptional ArsR family regulator